MKDSSLPRSRVPDWIKSLEPEIVSLYKKGNSVRALVRQFGVGHNAIQRMLERNGVERRDMAAAGVLCRTRAPRVPIHPDPNVSIAMQVAWHMGHQSSAGLSKNRKFRTACEREYAARSPEVYRRNESKRKEAENRIPEWQDRRELEAFWDEANSRGLEVDHINPLQGDDISGLNVISNLQMLPTTDNLRKYNKFLCGPDYTIPPYAPARY